ncbi:flagellar motor switch phosphatase FliY [Spirochaeta cellobiosiphila]|uniref:flagellar motor switch phosphatase FliY n=1 Tax=Spirochaeta cellobiosiphila TaxID=504483 RepID=UPI00041D6C7B|nr:flagellar motor switch phosphatase FliY [Spirochaeta cellobiosiphila]
MSDLTLSQDEIDALLTGGSENAPDPSGASNKISFDLSSFSGLLTPLVGSQANNLSSMMSGQNVSIDPPEIKQVKKEDLQKEIADEVIEIKVDYTDGINGDHSYIFSGEDALKIAGPMVGQDNLELNDAAIAAVGEAASLLTGSAVTTFSTQTGKNISPAPPEGKKIPKAMLRLPEGDFVLAKYKVNIDSESLTMFEIFDAEIINSLVAKPQDQASFNGGQNQMGFNNMNNMGQNQMPQMQMNPNQMMGGNMGMYGNGNNNTNVQGVQFPTLTPNGFQGDQGNIGLLMDVFMEVTVELGRARRLIKDILGMGEGTIIALDKLAGEPVDILVNHKLIAKGEVVVIDENFGVRVTEIVNQVEKMSDSM